MEVLEEFTDIMKKKNYFIVGLIFVVFFVVSFLTNILGPIIPDIIDSFKLSLTMAAFLPFAFFIAYGVMSIPAGMLVEKFGEKFGMKELNAAIYEGAVQRVRPKLMTVFAILAGLAPIMYTHGVGSEVMQRIAAPMLGGVVSSAVLSLIIIPILFDIYQTYCLKNKN
jgi:Cu(I)/Ag(I) efflux system membrane protein CusA/SilA